MLRKSFLMFFAVLFFVFLPSTVPNSGQIQRTRQTNLDIRPFTELTFEINLPDRSLLPLQPIPVVLKLSNRTAQSVWGYGSIGFGSPLFLYVQKSGTQQRVHIYPLMTMDAFIGIINSEVKPGVSHEKKEWITLELNKYFPEPGTYELQAVLYNADRTQSIESNRINIEIQEPIGINRTAYNLIRNHPSVSYLFSDAQFDKKKEVLEAITTRFPNSGYAKSAFYVIGERYFMRKQYPQALINLLRLENDSNFIFAEKVRNYLAEIRRLPLNEQQENEKNQ